MIMLEESTRLYATVLRQLLPTGGYDTAPNTVIAADILAHAKALAQSDIDAKRLLNTLSSIPTELLSEYEAEFGLPLQCRINTVQDIEERLQLLQWIKQTHNVLNKAYLKQLLAWFGVELISIQNYHPMQCIGTCTAPLNTEQLRYKVKLKTTSSVDLSCIAQHYLPAYLRIEQETIHATN